MNVRHSKAIVLRRMNYGEYDRILQILTSEYGKVSVLAKGVRREKSKLAGGIELFARSDITFTSGKSSMGTLTGSRLEKFYDGILADYDRLQFGYEAIKQISKAADNLDEPAFFELLDQTFSFLATQTILLDVIRIWFWLQLAILLGEGANLATDDQGMKLREDTRYSFDPEYSVFQEQPKGIYTDKHIKLLRLLSAQPPTIAMNVRGIEGLLEDCLWFAERVFAH